MYELVLNMEQIMSTGGGWQDQVGGLTPGVKYITSRPGIRQKIHVTYLELDQDTKKELQERFVLIYTGQRRLARNLLREVVGNYIGGRRESIEALKEMKRLAVLMRFELEQGNIDASAMAGFSSGKAVLRSGRHLRYMEQGIPRWWIMQRRT